MRARIAAVGAAAVAAVLCVAPASFADNDYNSGGTHWPRTGGEWPAHVTFVDHMGSFWPVGRVTQDWDVPSRLDVDYLDAGTGSCSHHCTPVRSYAPENDPYNVLTQGCTNTNGQVFGYFVRGGDGTGHFDDNVDAVALNRDCNARSDSFRRALTCQEVGHATGLDHAAVTSSCMYQNPFYAATTPRQHDYDMLQAVYNH